MSKESKATRKFAQSTRDFAQGTKSINNYFDQLGKEIHKRAVKKFPRRKVYSHYPNDIHSADIVDMSAFQDANNGYRYILAVIDVYSRYAWCIPLRKKNTEDVMNAFKKLYQKSVTKPSRLWTDQGGEFYNTKMKAWCKSNGITLYSTFGDHKAAVVERFNRTIKEKLYKMMTRMYTDDWMTYLPDLLKEYNETKHKTTKQTPRDIYDGKASLNFNSSQSDTTKPSYRIGDTVRISRIKKTFEKGYAPSWSTAVYKVHEVLDTDPITYKLKDKKGEILEGSFYEPELQKTKLDRMLIVKIIKKRKEKGKPVFLVQYHGYTDDFNEWLSKEDILSSDELNNKYYKPEGVQILQK